MLVLSRRIDEEIVIETPQGQIYVMVISVDIKGKVRLGVSAPREVPVHRREVLERIQREGEKRRQA